MKFLSWFTKWVSLILVSLFACLVAIFLLVLFMLVFGINDEGISRSFIDHRILLIILAFTCMAFSYLYLYKK